MDMHVWEAASNILFGSATTAAAHQSWTHTPAIPDTEPHTESPSSLPRETRGHKVKGVAKASSATYRNRNKTQIGLLEQQHSLMVQKLEALTVENEHLRYRSTVLKDVVDCVDKAEALCSKNQSCPSPEERLARWKTLVHLMTQKLLKMELDDHGNDHTDELNHYLREVEQAVMSCNTGDAGSDDAVEFLQLHLSEALPLIKVPEEQHWPSVVASLQLTPQQRRLARVAKEALDKLTPCPKLRATVLCSHVANLVPPPGMPPPSPPANPTAFQPSPTPLQSHPTPTPQASLSAATHGSGVSAAFGSPTPPDAPCGLPDPGMYNTAAAPGLNGRSGCPNLGVARIEYYELAQQLIHTLERGLQSWDKRQSVTLLYLHRCLLTPQQAVRAHVHAYPMLASPTAVLHYIAALPDV